MLLRNIYLTLILWHTAIAITYQDQTLTLDGATAATKTLTENDLLVLKNSHLTIQNYTNIDFVAGIDLSGSSTLTVYPPVTPSPGATVNHRFHVGGKVTLTEGSTFIYNARDFGSANSIPDGTDSVIPDNWDFDIDAGADGIFVDATSKISIAPPELSGFDDSWPRTRASFHVGGHYEAPYNSFMHIEGTLEVVYPHYYPHSRQYLPAVDLGPDKIVPDGLWKKQNLLSGKLDFSTVVQVYADIFEGTDNATIIALDGFHGYAPISTCTINTRYHYESFQDPDVDPGTSNSCNTRINNIILAEGSGTITLPNLLIQNPPPCGTYLFQILYDDTDSFNVSNVGLDRFEILNQDSGKKTKLNVPNIDGGREYIFVSRPAPNLETVKKIPHRYPVTYQKQITVVGYDPLPPPVVTTLTIPGPEETDIYVVSQSPYTNEYGVPAYSDTYYIAWIQPKEDTQTIDLGNGITEYVVRSYDPIPGDTPKPWGVSFGTLTHSIVYSPPPVTTTTITQPNYLEEDIISFFITTDVNGVIITGTTTITSTAPLKPSSEADYTTTIDKGNGDFETDLVSHITTQDSDGKPTTITTTIPLHGPAPPAVTKTVDLGNEVTEYLVISYWTTTNEFGGLITTNSTATYSPPPVTVTATTASDYIESDWISFFITTDEKGDIVTSSTLFNATRDYNLPEAPHTSFGPAPPAVTKTVDLGNEVTEYLVISYWTTTNEFGGLITTNSTATYRPPPVTVTATTASDYIESDWISFFITTDEKGDIVTSSTLFNATRDYNLPEAPHTSFGPAPPAVTKTVDLGNEVTEYLVISYWTTTNEFGGLITTNSTATYSPPPVTVTATTASDYIESDWISFFITTDEKGDIVTSSTLFNATRDYNLPEAPRTSFGPAPPAVTKTVDLGNEVTEYLVISYWTTTNEFGGLITTNSTATYSPPPVTVTATTASDYIESDWISFFITTDEKGDIVTSSTLFNATRDYNLPEAPHSSFGPAPPAVTKTVDLGNEVTEYLVISYWTTTNEFGGLITTNSTATYSPPPVTVTATTASDYIESDWISFFITTDEKGDIVTSSTLFNATRDYNLPEAPHTSFGPAPPAVTKTVDLGNEVTEYLVISYWTTTNEFGGLITTNSTATYSPPPVTVTATTASDYIESDWISFFITTDEKGDIVTSSTLFNATRDYIDAQAPYTSSTSYSKSKVEESDYTTTIDKGNGDFETDLVSHITTKDSDGKPTTITTTIPLKPSDAGEADYTTTIDKGNGDFETDLVSHITTKDSDGKPTTITTTIPLKPSDAGEADYTTTIDKGNGDFETDLVFRHITGPRTLRKRSTDHSTPSH
ncbi:hypothetical protein J7293_00957 [Nakaseomyces glabratus]|nr:hypothetical protein J7293_00957 [Nakaseomyces glabratus]